MADRRRPVMTMKKSREIERTIYTDWANHHLDKTGIKRLIQDLPSDISDGVLLADIVQFVCGQEVGEIHTNPQTAEEKLNNIDRCLQLLQSHNITLNDVTAKGLYLRELKCVLALFFHLTKYKKSDQQTNMGDAVKLSQRHTLRPPSNIAVGRKGRSFNTNDKNKIKSGSSSNVRTTPNSPVSAAANEGIPQTNFGALPSGTIGWRSKSMNVKHSATTRLIPPKTRTPTLQTFKPDRPLSSNAPSVTSQSSDSQSIVSSDKDNRKPAAMNGGTLHSQRNMKSTVDKSEVKTIQNGSLLRATNDRANKLSIMKHSANQRSISVVKSTSPNRIAGKLTSKNHTSQSTLQSTPNGRKPASVMSRLRKLGTTTSNTPTTSTKPRSTSASKTALNSVSSSSSNMKKRAESCPPTSRLGTMRPQSLQKAQAPSNGCNIEANKKPSGKTTTGKSNLKSPSSLKSVKTTIGKAFGGAKQNEKKKSPTTPTSLPGLFNKSSAKKAGISKSEIRPMVPMVTEENPKPPTIISADLPPSEELRNDEDSAPLSSGYKDTTEIYKAVEPVSIASPRAVKKAHKTATVAPFNRQPVPVEQSITNDSLECKDMRKSLRGLQLKKENVDFKEIEVDEKGISPTTPAEAREMAVKGIADLRHNLEETMCSLRNTQLRHRADDAFQRRISAQLDGVEFDQINEAPCSGSLYRSHHNILSGRTNVRSPASFNSASPKLHAGETLGDHTAYKFGPGRFSSLQRTRSTRYPRTAWREVTTGYVSEGDALAAPKVETNGYLSDGAILGDVINKKSQKWDNATESLEDASSISSSEISECIADVNTDDVSSNNNSPYHHVRQVPLDQGDNLSFKLRNLGKESPNSTMTIESSTKSLKLSKRKAFTKPPSGKLGLRTPGSSVVGSRLAGNESTIYSPTSLKSEQPSLASRGSLCYRSLPRPHKSRLYEEAKTYVINTTQPACKLSDPRNPTNFGSYNSKASPSLERFHVLGKNSADSIKVTATTAVRTEPCVTFPQSRTTATTTVYHKPSPTKVEFSTSVATLDASPMNRRGMSYYSSMGRPGKTARNISASPLSYMSLPRSRRTIVTSSTTSAASPASTVTTWSPKRMNANRAYSIAPPTSNPFMSLDILSTPSLYLDEKNPMNSKMTEDILRQAAGRGGGVSDWPLPTLHSSSNLHDPDMPTSTIHVQTRDNNSSSADSCLGSSININDKRNNQLNTRSCSVMSSTPSLYSLTEDSVVPMGTNLDSLKGDSTLRSTLHKKVKVVTAFEESLSSMNDRFKQLSVTAEEKDSELQELRATIENLRRNRSPDDWSNSSCALKKKASCGSLSSITSSVSVGSTEDGQKRRKKHWLKESLKTAFGKRKSRNNMTPNEPEENDKKSLRENKEDTDVVAKLKEELLMKERKLTDIRLEALTSQHQLHQMQDAMQKMRNEMETLRQENDRLNRLELSTTSMDVMTHKENDFCQETNHMMNGDVRMKVMVEFPQHVIHDDMDEQAQETRAVISVCYVSRSIGWEYLDEMIKNIFQTYCEEVDPNTGLHLSSDSVASYSVGEATRFIGEETPDLLPCGYIVGNVDTINVRLRDGNTGSVDSLALELLIDRDTIKRYTQLVLDHGRVMLCGPAGTGKSTLANRLAEHVVRMTPKRSGLGAIVKFDLKQGNEIEISEYLHQLSEDCSKPESCGRDIPVVLVLDGIHGSSLLQGAFTPLLTTAAHSQLPYLIGVAQQNCASELELHQEFRWILCSNHTPPVSQFLHRSLKRTLHSWQIDNSCNCDDVMYDVVDWLPRCWQNINKCIETYNSADVTLGPRLFTKCPMDVTSSKAWFTDLWNFSVIPYVISAVKQGSKKATTQWCDPAQWVKESWPWSESCDLLSIRSEDVAIDSKSCVDSAFPNVTSQSNDPLLNMLLKLQEVAATNYGSDGSHDDVNHDDAFERSLDQALGDLS